MVVDKQTFKAALERSWSHETSSKWTAGSPATGQCSVTALLVQDWYGGNIAKTPIEGAWHFYNVIDGDRLDLSADQFARAIHYADIKSNRTEAFGDTTEEQYRILVARLREQLSGDTSTPSEET